MASIGELKEELGDLVTMKFISQAFTEASAARIQKLKNKFELNYQFYKEISHVYHVVRVSSVIKAAPVPTKVLGKFKKTPPKVIIDQPTGKKLMVALTSNQRFYGTINVQIMQTFIPEALRENADIWVVGLTGRDVVKSGSFPREYKFMQFAKELPNDAEVTQFLADTEAYDSVVLYFPKFETLLRQSVGVLDITQAATPTETIDTDEINILFEPELSKALAFFKASVRQVLLHRCLLETDLARTAARLVAMSAAEERSDELIKAKKSAIRKVHSAFVNRRLLETFAGIKKWKK